MGQIRRIGTAFFCFWVKIGAAESKKIRLNPPNPPHPFSHFPYKKLLGM